MLLLEFSPAGFYHCKKPPRLLKNACSNYPSLRPGTLNDDVKDGIKRELTCMIWSSSNKNSRLSRTESSSAW